MSLRDMLQNETADGRNAADAAAQGVSLTGLSGRQQTIGETVFGARAEQASPGVGDEGSAIAPNRARQRAGTVRERVPFGGAELRLAWAKRPGYRRYWFNDTFGRIGRAKSAGYEHVLHPETGAPVSTAVGTDRSGAGMMAYLMEVPEQWYWEDMAVQQGDLEKRLADIRAGRSGPGAEDSTRYVPQRGITFGSQRTA